MQVSPHIDEYSVEQNFIWKKFPFEENKLSILIVYGDNTIVEMKRLINKLLLIFPEKFYYDDEKNNWIKLPPNSNGYRVSFLDKIVRIPPIDKINNTTLIITDDLLLEDPKNYEDYKLDISTINREENKQNIIEPISNMMINNLDKNTKIFKILEYKTFISHIISIANIKSLEQSYYEKFDIIFFTTMDIVNTFSCTRTYRQLGIDKMIPDKVFVTDLKEMKNNLYLYSI